MSTIQAVLFDRNYYTPQMATKWLNNHQMYPIKPLHATDRYIRARIRQPNGTMRTITLDRNKHIKAIVNTGGRGMFGHVAPSGIFGRLTWRRTSKHGGAIGSDLAVGTATVALPLLAFAAKKIYDRFKGGYVIDVRGRHGRSSVRAMI